MDLISIHNLSAYIGTSKSSSTWTYAQMCAGFDNIAESLNEVVQQYFFLCGGGFAYNRVTGMAPAITFTGRRVLGDSAQDYIFSKKYAVGSDRESSFKLEYTDSANTTHSVVCNCTICNVQEWSGATTDDSAISVEIRFNGAPTVDGSSTSGSTT